MAESGGGRVGVTGSLRQASLEGLGDVPPEVAGGVTVGVKLALTVSFWPPATET